jgi:hypothetical protein
MLWSGDIKIIDGIPTYTYFSFSIGLYAGKMQRKIPVIRYTDYWDFILFRPFNGGSFL